MTTIKVIDNGEFKKVYADKLGSLMFPAEYYDCKHHVNTAKLRKNLEKEGIILLKGAKLLRVLVPTTNNENFKNEQNIKVPYKHPICAAQTDDGAYQKSYPEMNYITWVNDYPLGNAIVVFNITMTEIHC